jgi:hypothetical protein
MNRVLTAKVVTPGCRIGYMEHTGGCHQLNRVLKHNNNVVKSGGVQPYPSADQARCVPPPPPPPPPPGPPGWWQRKLTPSSHRRFLSFALSWCSAAGCI